MLHQIWMQAIKLEALKAVDNFDATDQAKQPKTVDCLLKDKEEFLASTILLPSIGSI